MSRKNSKQSNGVEPFGGLLKSTLDDFLRSVSDYLQLPTLLSRFISIDHKKNISSCIAQVVALWGRFENCPVGGGKLNPCSLILIWDTGTSYGLTLFAVILSATWSVIFLFGMSPKLTRSLGLELHCTNLLPLMVNQSSSHAYPITIHRQTFIFSPIKHTIKCTVVISRFTRKAFR
jgi:hypothetical protein